jgi:hypothetical protein
MKAETRITAIKHTVIPALPFFPKRTLLCGEVWLAELSDVALLNRDMKPCVLLNDAKTLLSFCFCY